MTDTPSPRYDVTPAAIVASMPGIGFVHHRFEKPAAGARHHHLPDIRDSERKVNL